MKKPIVLTVLGIAVVFLMGASEQETQIADLQTQLRVAQAEIRRLKVHPMPVRIGQRKAVLSNGQVLQIENVSLESLPVKITLTSPTFGKSKEFDEILAPAKLIPTVKEIGHTEGWDAAAGDQIQIESKGFQTLEKHF